MFDRIRKLFGAPHVGDEASMISCEDALRLVHDYLDGELEGRSAEEVQRHFDICSHCYPHLHLETVCRDTLRRAATGEGVPEELRNRVAALIAEARSDG
jgi:anti-sigma factor (TIGR02949 family)